MNFYSVETSEDGVAIKAVYVPAFIEELKDLIPIRSRKWDRERRAWIIGKEFEDTAIRLVRKYFEGLKPHIMIAAAIETERVIDVNGIPLFRFTRDYVSKMRSPIVNTITIIRFGAEGSRRHPLFSGVASAIVYVNKNTVIAGDEWAWKTYPYTPINAEKAKNIEFKSEWGSVSNEWELLQLVILSFRGLDTRGKEVLKRDEDIGSLLGHYDE